MKGKEKVKALDIFKALENTDDDLLEKCTSYGDSKIKIKKKCFAAVAAVACLCAAAGTGIYLTAAKENVNAYGSKCESDIDSSDKDTESQSDISEAVGKDSDNAEGQILESQDVNGTDYGKTKSSTETTDEANDIQETYAIPHWDEMSLPERFSEFERNGSSYFVYSNVLDDESRIDEKLGDVTITGYDIYTDEEYSINAEIYSISKLSQNYMTAIRYEGYDDYYPCENSDYHPADLQQLISDTNLREEMTFSEIYYSYFDDEMNYYDVDYFVDNSDVFWTELFDKAGDPQAINAEDIPMELYSDYDFNCESELIRGCIGISSNGYIITNISSTGSAFYIGEDKVKDFIDYIDENFNKGVSVIDSEPFNASEEILDVETETSPDYAIAE